MTEQKPKRLPSLFPVMSYIHTQMSEHLHGRCHVHYLKLTYSDNSTQTKRVMKTDMLFVSTSCQYFFITNPVLKEFFERNILMIRNLEYILFLYIYISVIKGILFNKQGPYTKYHNNNLPRVWDENLYEMRKVRAG